MLQLLKLIKILNSDTSPSAIAGAICCALFIGLTPLTSPHNLLIIFMVLLFRIHIGTFVLAAIGFKLIGFAFEGAIELLGLALLQNPSFEAFWTSIYNTQIGRLSFFNYSTTLGGLFIRVVGFIPIWLLSVLLIKQYRTHIKSWIQK